MNYTYPLVAASVFLVFGTSAMAQPSGADQPRPTVAAPGYPPQWGYPPPPYPAGAPPAYYGYPPPPYGPPPAQSTTRRESVGSDVPLGQGVHLLLSVAPLFGYAHTWMNLSSPRYQGVTSDGSASTSTDTIAFLGNSGAASMDPTLAFDVMLPVGVTLGGAFQYGWNGGNETLKSGTGRYATESTQKMPSTTAFGLGARGGYLHMFNDVLGIWGTVGGSYRVQNQTSYSDSSYGTSTDSESDTTAFSLDSNVALIVSPVRHFAFVFGAGGSVLLSGTITSKSGGTTDLEADVSGSAIGLGVGLLGYL